MGTVKRSHLFEGQPDCVPPQPPRRTGDACQLHRLHLAQPSWPPANCPFYERLPTSRSPPNSLLASQGAPSLYRFRPSCSRETNVEVKSLPHARPLPFGHRPAATVQAGSAHTIDRPGLKFSRNQGRQLRHAPEHAPSACEQPTNKNCLVPDDPLGQADCQQRPPAGYQRELALSTRHRSHSLEQARGPGWRSAGLLARRVPNGSLATSVSCRVDGAAALSVRRA